jgi:hypothetical protein
MMNIDIEQLETAFVRVIEGIKTQEMPSHLKRRWTRATEKAQRSLIEQPYFAWQPERLLIVSIPKEKTKEIGCRFYEANESACRRVDKSGLCQAFYEGIPCWHRAAYLLLKIYLGEMDAEGNRKQTEKNSSGRQLSTLVDTFS